MLDLDKQAFHETNKLNSKYWIIFNCTKKYIYQEVKLNLLPRITNKNKAKYKFNDNGTNKVGKLINTSD